MSKRSYLENRLKFPLDLLFDPDVELTKQELVVAVKSVIADVVSRSSLIEKVEQFAASAAAYEVFTETECQLLLQENFDSIPAAALSALLRDAPLLELLAREVRDNEHAEEAWIAEFVSVGAYYRDPSKMSTLRNQLNAKTQDIRPYAQAARIEDVEENDSGTKIEGSKKNETHEASITRSSDRFSKIGKWLVGTVTAASLLVGLFLFTQNQAFASEQSFVLKIRSKIAELFDLISEDVGPEKALAAIDKEIDDFSPRFKETLSSKHNLGIQRLCVEAISAAKLGKADESDSLVGEALELAEKSTELSAFSQLYLRYAQGVRYYKEARQHTVESKSTVNLSLIHI